MTEQFRKAPDGQPTSNIEFQLKHAQDDEREWRVAKHHYQIRLDGATETHQKAAERVAELQWQLGQRKAAGVE